MSHTTTLKGLAIKDAKAIEAAVADLQKAGLKCSLEKNTKPRMYYRRQEEDCDLVVRLNGEYKAKGYGKPMDLGFKLQPDGTYAIIFDEWADIVSDQIGANKAVCPLPNTPEGRAQHAIGRFSQLYAKHAAINAASMQGYIVTGTTEDAEGNIHLTVAA